MHMQSAARNKTRLGNARSFLGDVFLHQTFSASYSMQHHVRIRHRRDYDDQEAVLGVKGHYQGYEKTRNVQVRRSKISQRLR